MGTAIAGQCDPLHTRGEFFLNFTRVLREGRCDFPHEAGHLVLDLVVRLEADGNVEDHLGDPGCLNLLQAVGDLGWATRAAPSYR